VEEKVWNTFKTRVKSPIWCKKSHSHLTSFLRKIETEFLLHFNHQSITKMPVDSYETSLNTACGRTTTFKNKKQMTTWIRLHKKKCDKCNHATFSLVELEVQHDWANRNELESATARGNAVLESILQFGGEDNYILPPRNRI